MAEHIGVLSANEQPAAGTCPALGAALIGLDVHQIAVLKNLVRAGLLHVRQPGEVIPEGMSLQPCQGTHLVARVHLRKKNHIVVMNLYTGGSHDIQIKAMEP